MDPISLSAMAASAIGGISSAAAGAASLAAGVSGTALSAVGAGVGAASTAASYMFQSGLAAQNAKIAQQNASYALMSGEQQASNAGLKGRVVEGQIRASQGASGLNVNTGTSKDVQEGQRLVDETNLTTIRSNSAKQAYDYEVTAAADKAQSGMYKNAAIGSGIAGAFNMAGSILGGGTSVASKWSSMAQSGAMSGSDPTMLHPGLSGNNVFGF